MGNKQSFDLSRVKKFIKKELSDKSTPGIIISKLQKNKLLSVHIDYNEVQFDPYHLYVCTINVLIPNKNDVKIITKTKYGYNYDTIYDLVCKKLINKILKL